MIKLERTDVMNMDNALRGMRNPMKSWDKADSEYCALEDDLFNCDVCWYQNNCPAVSTDYVFHIGPNDMKLATGLIRGGSDERKFLRQIFVSVDITAPLYWWKEYDTYKVGTVANSESTMHKIHEKVFVPDDFSREKLKPSAMRVLEMTIKELNIWRDIYNNGGLVDENCDGHCVFYKPKSKEAWEQMIQLLPTSFNQMRTCTLNYEVLLNQYFARRNHKLTEWREFCAWAEELPYFKQFKEVLEK